MWLCKKKNKTEKVVGSNENLFNNIAKTKIIVAMAENTAIKQKLENSLEELRYSSPSAREDVVKIDDKIDKKLDDIKIMLSSNKSADKVMEEIAELDILIVKRKSVTEI